MMPDQPDSRLETVPARRGRAVKLNRGQTIRLLNKFGTQVVDVWAFNARDRGERMSMAHTRAFLNRIFPAVNDTFVTNRRSPIVTIIQDTTPGHHDMLMPACDTHRYTKQYGLKDYHDNCADNLRDALKALGEDSPEHIPDPFNAFMNIPLSDGNRLSWEKPTSQPGQYIEFRAEMNLIMVFSACPNDVMDINGKVSRDAYFMITTL